MLQNHLTLRAHERTQGLVDILEELYDLCEIHTLKVFEQRVVLDQLVIEELYALLFDDAGRVHLVAGWSDDTVLELAGLVLVAVQLGREVAQEGVDISLALVWHSWFDSDVQKFLLSFVLY